ncbi:hypothetical protein CEP53_004564 [Fusarium sp. AF-6]|nr:hypothetical protein CEP53_004564 [Fusarium sp. AF-6]
MHDVYCSAPTGILDQTLVLLPTLLPKIEISFALTLLGFVSFTIAVLTKSKQKQSASTVFLEYTNQTGWNDGIAFLIGVGQQMFGFLGLDCASHVAEEMPNPARGVPRVMALTMIIGIITSAVWTVAFMFSAADYDAAIIHQSPITAICLQALGSDAAGLAVSSILLVLFFGGALACHVAAGRQTWAFARDNGMPYSHIIGQIHPTLKAPMNATILTGVFCVIYGLIYIGSSAAFTSFIGLLILGLNTTYVFPQALVLLYGRKNVLPPKRPINFGFVLGLLVNLYSVLLVMLYVVIFRFPTYLNTKASSMNYLSVVVVGVLIFILISWWVGKRRSYGGPIIDGGVLEGMSHVNPEEDACRDEKGVEAVDRH